MKEDYTFFEWDLMKNLVTLLAKTDECWMSNGGCWKMKWDAQMKWGCAWERDLISYSQWRETSASQCESAVKTQWLSDFVYYYVVSLCMFVRWKRRVEWKN